MQYVYEVQGNYGLGWEEVCTEGTETEAWEQLEIYEANEPGIQFRVERILAEKSKLLTVRIDMANDAFSDPGEVSRILRKLADTLDNGATFDTISLYDINGHSVGWATLGITYVD